MQSVYQQYYTSVRGCGSFVALCLSVAAAAGGALPQDPILNVRVADADGGSAELRLLEDARATAIRFDNWLGTRPVDAIVLDRVPWYDPRVGTAADSTIFIPHRWLAPDEDRADERALIAGMAQLYWQAGVDIAAGTFAAGIRQYVVTRAIHEQLLGVNHFTLRFFGGFVGHVIRPLPLSTFPQDPRPPVRRFDELRGGSAVWRIVDALYTLERYLGWPAVQHAVMIWLRSPARDVAAFDTALWRATAQDAGWFTAAAFSPAVRYDYGVVELTTTALAAGHYAYENAVTIGRFGDGVFPIDVAVVFADGTRIHERWDGGGTTVSYHYSSQAPATAVVVDPDSVLLLDADRRNNAHVVTAPLHVPALRWTMQWATWLQDALVTVTALL